MTLEESKIEIQDIIDIYEKEDMYPLLNDRQISALKMAISALQAQDSSKPTAESVQNVKDDDLVSRKAAIDAPFKKFDMDTGVTWIPLEYIEQLPSTQPEIIRGKDCRKHNVSSGYKNDCCALYEWRGMSYGHEHDYQFCCFAERRIDE